MAKVTLQHFSNVPLSKGYPTRSNIPGVVFFTNKAQTNNPYSGRPYLYEVHISDSKILNLNDPANWATFKSAFPTHQNYHGDMVAHARSLGYLMAHRHAEVFADAGAFDRHMSRQKRNLNRRASRYAHLAEYKRPFMRPAWDLISPSIPGRIAAAVKSVLP